MYRLLIKLLSLLIIDKEKRYAFRMKFDPIERLKERLYNTRCEYAGKINGVLYPIRQDSLLIAVNAIRNGIIKDYQEYLQDLEGLKKNLSETSNINLNKILNRFFIAETSCTIDYNKLYTGTDYEDFLDTHFLYKKIYYKDGYYQFENYKLPIRHFEPSVVKYKHGLNTLKTIKNISKESVIIDAGAFIYESALIFREFFDNKIISFEPTPESYELGKKTIELNKLSNIVYENKALGNKNETLNIYCDSRANCNHVSSQKNNTVPCESVRLDDYVKEHDLTVGLIKTDVEGFEQQLLEGSLETIKRDKPILMISIYHNYHDFYKIKPWIEDLNLGYKFDFFQGNIGSIGDEILLIAEVY